MTVDPFATQSIVEVTPRVVVVRGVETADWANPVRRTLDGWDVQAGKGGRDFEYGSGVTRVRNLYGPFDADPDPEARYELPGERGLFVVLDGPNYHDDAEHVLGLPVGPRHVKLVVGIKEG